MKRYLYIILLEMCTSCIRSNSSSTKLNSENYKSKSARIDISKREIKYYSDFQDAEFDLFNVNGFHDQETLVPGATSYYYKFVLKINTIDISKWTSGMKEIELEDYDAKWTKEIIRHRSQNWNTNSKPKFLSEVAKTLQC